MYVRCRKKIGTLKLFPMQVCLVPIINGLFMQLYFREIYITWTSVVIAVAGIMTALKNELIFIDRLTGLYNRTYLTYLQQEAQKKKSELIAGIMLDLNGFKQINDNYGHYEGDSALILVADLLRKAFGEYGIVTRYAGDEFVVMLHTTDEQLITDLIARAKDIFEEENKTNDKPFQLSASMGYALSDLSKETIDDFMNRIDKLMYQDKLAYYEKNDRRIHK
ncbi:MAG: GGDEF domain-containing protein [Roseburia inulinivorans]|nr:GGDEF domain-containing protein [Roseburia inulinivorans]